MTTHSESMTEKNSTKEKSAEQASGDRSELQDLLDDISDTAGIAQSALVEVVTLARAEAALSWKAASLHIMVTLVMTVLAVFAWLLICALVAGLAYSFLGMGIWFSSMLMLALVLLSLLVLLVYRKQLARCIGFTETRQAIQTCANLTKS